MSRLVLLPLPYENWFEIETSPERPLIITKVVINRERRDLRVPLTLLHGEHLRARSINQYDAFEVRAARYVEDNK